MGGVSLTWFTLMCSPATCRYPASNPASCQPKTCPTLSNSNYRIVCDANAAVSGSDGRCRASCQVGYETSGSSTSEKLGVFFCNNGQWSGSFPTCSPVNCGDPPTEADTTLLSCSKTYMSTCQRNCKTTVSGQPNGYIRYQCQASGHWKTVAHVKCPVPPPAPQSIVGKVCVDEGTNAPATGWSRSNRRSSGDGVSVCARSAAGEGVCRALGLCSHSFMYVWPPLPCRWFTVRLMSTQSISKRRSTCHRVRLPRAGLYISVTGVGSRG